MINQSKKKKENWSSGERAGSSGTGNGWKRGRQSGRRHLCWYWV